MLSQKPNMRCALLLMLAERPAGEPLLIADIAARQNLPKKFLELILLDLKHHGLLHSKRGKHGGYALARSPSEISFGEVVRHRRWAAGPGDVRQPDRLSALRGLPRRGDLRRPQGIPARARRHRRHPRQSAHLADANRRGHKGQRPVAS